MEDYDILYWPDVQFYMDLPGFSEHTALITPNENIGIGSSTYLVEKEWLNTFDKEE